MIKKWLINSPDENAVKELSAKGGLTSLAARTLVSAGIDTMDKAVSFFGQQEEKDFDMGFSDPFLIRDMERACELLNEAVDSGELICVYGDYDCDGVTATAVLSGYLTDIGGNVITYINERSEGYGMNLEAVKKLSERGVSLIVTVDNGISAIDEAALCKELGITLIITDHHQPRDILPEAAAVVDPHRPDCPSFYKDYCGCGLALKLIAAMEGGDMERAVEQYSDLAAIATVADVVPLTGENREIVRYGLHYLENTENEGLRALIEKSGLKPPYTSTSAAFTLAPRINAAGRIGSPSDALKLLMSETPEEAEEYAEKVCALNSERKEYENKMIADIAAQIKADSTLLDGRVLVFRGNGWHHGVIGIAAARCVEKFGKPVFLMSADEGETELRGSARSIEGLNVFKALSFAEETLTKFGGHSGAGGFSLEADKFPMFRQKLLEYADIQAAEGIPCVPVIQVGGAISPSELTVQGVKGLTVLEPFGEGNPRPVFLLQGCRIDDIISLSNGAHTKLSVSGGGTQLTGLMFGTKTDEFPLKRGDEANLLISPEINSFGGKESVSLRITDIRRKGLNQQKLIAAEETYYMFRRGEKLDGRLIPLMIPERADLAAVYKAAGRQRLSPMGLYSRLETEMNYCKFLLCLDIFSETGLMEFDRCAEKVHIIPGAPKANTDLAPTMQRLKALI
ncbi:MAG: single-stranded-DNA-specific exonuclease RecJ [Huintestinicola sp.]|uniref:single-stranded-DNA-specific exonuclease RecJ n=1 Tax=Huintestinicola sp. TaxID=2981661 RepID=UPI003EFE549D